MSNAQLSKKPVFWYNGTTGAIWTGLPEQYPSPSGFQKIVCNSASEAEQWSARQRKWDQLMHEVTIQEREMVEGPQREKIRSEIRHQMANSRNNVNREFLRRYLETSETQESKWKYTRESYLHAEAFEKGH